MKKILRTLATIGDLVIDLSLKVYAIYLFFFKQDFLDGAFVFGMSALYSLSMAAALYFRKEEDKESKNPYDQIN